MSKELKGMREFMIVLPARTNDAMRSYNWEHTHIKEYILDLAGGYTELAPAAGVWRDGQRTYRDQMYSYVVAMPATVASEKKWRAIVDKAFALFHDQVAIYWKRGSVVFIERRAN